MVLNSFLLSVVKKTYTICNGQFRKTQQKWSNLALSLKPCGNGANSTLFASNFCLEFLLKALTPFDVIQNYWKSNEKHFLEQQVVYLAKLWWPTEVEVAMLTLQLGHFNSTISIDILSCLDGRLFRFISTSLNDTFKSSAFHLRKYDSLHAWTFLCVALSKRNFGSHLVLF